MSSETPYTEAKNQTTSTTPVKNYKIIEIEDTDAQSNQDKFKSLGNSRLDKQKQFELKLIDERLAHGHIVYFLTILTVLVVVGVNFLFHVDISIPLPLEIFRVILVGLIMYIMASAMTALRERKYYLQTIVVYYLKWYTGLLIVYTVLKLAFMASVTTSVILIHVAEIMFILGVLWASRRVEAELKKREDLYREISYESFYV